MDSSKFNLKALISSDNLPAVRAVVEEIVRGHGIFKETDKGLEVEAEFEGESAQSLNRTILSQLRHAEKRTRLRSEWTSNGTCEKFFDYVSKSKCQID